MKQQHDLIGFGMALLATAIISCTAIMGPFLADLQSKGLYELLKDWQTLITGVFALAAAFIAAQPVRKQLRKMNIQSAVMARDVLAERLASAEVRQKKTRELLNTITDGFLRDMYWRDPEGEPEINSQWAFNAEGIARDVIKQVTSDQASKKDSLDVDASRKAVIEASQGLSDCLDDIHRPEWMDFSDPDYDLSADDIANIEKNSETGRSALTEKINLLGKERDKLDKAFDYEVERLRQRIRDIDDLIVEDELTER